MIGTSEQIQSSVRDMSDLVSLAEASAQRLDQIDLQRERSLTLLLLGCAMGAIGIFIGVAIGSAIEQFAGIPARVAATVCGATLTLFTGYSVGLFWSRRKRLTRSMFVERHVHERLVLLIDDQKRLLVGEGKLSSVAIATLELRISRLDRTHMRP
jgi:hypothetical protein